MKIVIFTGNSIRHKFVANHLSKSVDDTLVVSECTPSDNLTTDNSPITQHFNLREKTESDFFSNNDYFLPKTLPIMYKEVNSQYVYDVVHEFNPDMMFVFGSYIIKEPLLSLTPNKFVNLHLGLSPYYRGSGTNFWPFVNNELEYVGSTLLHLDPGIDTGDIIEHVRPNIEIGDTVHSVGCKVIKESVNHMLKLIEYTKNKKNIPRVKQWEVSNSKYYKTIDFDESVLEKYYENLQNGMIEDFINNEKKELKLVTLEND